MNNTNQHPDFQEVQDVPMFTMSEVCNLISRTADIISHPDYLSDEYLQRITKIEGYPQEIADHMSIVCNQVIKKIYG